MPRSSDKQDFGQRKWSRWCENVCLFVRMWFKGQRKLEMNSPFFSYESFAHAVSGAAVSFHLYNNPYARLGCIFIYL